MVPGTRLYRPDLPIPGAKDECLLPLQKGQRGSTVSRIVWQGPCPVKPDHLPGHLVESNKTMCRLRHLPPADHDRANDHHVIADDGKVGAAAVGTKQSKSLMHRYRPEGLAGLTIHALEIAADAQGIDPAGGRISHHATPANARVRNIRKPDIEAVLPDRLATGCIDTYNPLSLGGGFRIDTTHQVEPAVHHDRRTPASQVIAFPADVTSLTPTRIPVIDQAGFGGCPCIAGAAPVGPIERIRFACLLQDNRCHFRHLQV